MNNKNVYKKTKKNVDISFKLIKQLIFSVILFLTVLSIAKISPEFKETAKYYTRKNTDFKAVSKKAYDKIEQCFKEYNNIVDIK